MLKFYCDASFNEKTKKAIITFVLLENDKEKILYKEKIDKICNNSMEAESLSILEVLKFIKTKKFKTRYTKIKNKEIFIINDCLALHERLLDEKKFKNKLSNHEKNILKEIDNIRKNTYHSIAIQYNKRTTKWIDIVDKMGKYKDYKTMI